MDVQTSPSAAGVRQACTAGRDDPGHPAGMAAVLAGVDDLGADLSLAGERFRLLVETIPGVAYIAAPAADGQWHYISPRLRDLLGYDPADWLDDPQAWTGRIHPDDRERVLRNEAELASDPEAAVVAEYRLRHRDGGYRWVRDAATARPGGRTHEPVLWFGVLTDITASRAAEDALRVSEQMLRSVLQTARDAYVSTDPNGVVLDWNLRAEAMFGLPRSLAVGRSLLETVVPPQLWPRAEHVLGVLREARRDPAVPGARAAGRGRRDSEETYALRADGSQFPVEVVVWTTGESEDLRCHAFVRDITERRQLQEELRALAYHDALTGLANRSTLVADLETRLRERRPGTTLALLFLDVDDFKSVNDTLGHAAGDAVLTTAARRLVALCRDGETVARFAGDEFAVLVPDAGDPVRALQLARRVVDALADPVDLDGHTRVLTASVGVALVEGEGVATAATMLRDADAAMYGAKRGGKNRAMVFDPELHALDVVRQELRSELEGAVERGEMFLAYQPYFEVGTGRLAGFESLLRWDQPRRGLVPPLAFVPLAEETGRIRSIGAWVLVQSCRQAQAWGGGATDGGAPSLSVNVSVVQLRDPTFTTTVRDCLTATGLSPHRLVLEITESVLLTGLGEAARALQELRGLGVRIAIDDFGTGYSSLSYLQHLPLDILKIDRSFIEDVTEGEGGRSMAGTIVQVARSLRLQVVGEGVERQEQLQALDGLGCDLAQGYLLGRPLTPDQARALTLEG